MSLLNNSFKKFEVSATGVIQPIFVNSFKVITADFHILGGSGTVQMGFGNQDIDLLPAYSFENKEVKSLLVTGSYWDLKNIYFKASVGITLVILTTVNEV